MFQMLLYEGLLESARKTPDKIAIISDEKPCTYSNLMGQVIKLSNVLVQNGFKRGDRCVIYMDNTLSSVISIYATLLSGGVFVIVNSQTKKDKLIFVLKDCAASFFISDSNLYDNFASIRKDVQTIKSIIVSGIMDKIDDSSLLQFNEVIGAASNSLSIPHY